MGATCENCGRDADWERLGNTQANVYRCCRCGSWSYFGELDHTLAELYDEDYYNGGEYAGYVEGERSFTLNFKRMSRQLEAAGLPFRDMRLLEIGSATGLFLELARERGAKALGIEASEYCRALAKAKGLDILAPDTPETIEAIAALRPNCIVAWDVWEHLQHPAQHFDELTPLCTNDLVVAITTVDASSLVARWRGTRWRQFHPPTHLHYPTRAGLRHYFESRGFSISVHRSFGYYRPLFAYLQALGIKHREFLGRIGQLPLYVDLWDIQMVIARRSELKGVSR